MRILITGASGFIGGYLVSHLLKMGHTVICCVRDVTTTQHRFPLATTIPCNFNHDTHIDTWLPRLVNVDAVINCAGVLQASRKQNIHTIQYETPMALFAACVQLNISRVIQISALGVADGPDNDYVNTRRKLDEALLQMPLSSIILRPSLIYANGAYGGSSLIRALASLPFAILTPGTGQSKFQPVAMFDLLAIINHFLKSADQGIVNVVSVNPITIKDILIAFRQWLGFKPVKTLPISLILIKFVSKLGDIFGIGPINTVSMEMMQHENIADPQPLNAMLDFKTSPFPDGLAYYPSQTQDRWHARLYFLRPLLKLSLIVLWIFSGLIPLLDSGKDADALLRSLGLTGQLVPFIKISTCVWDIALGIALIFSFKNKLVGLLQILTILSYTLVASIGLTSLWLNPLAPLLKNIPILIAVLIWMAIEDMR